MLSPVTVINDLNDAGAHKTPPTAATGFNGTQLANHANSTSPTSATLSNTAAGYATLGGRWQFVPVSGAATDYALFVYLVPTTHVLVIRGIAISSHVFTAIGATASVLDWALAVNSTAVSLATTDADPVWAPRRRPLGTQCFLASAAAGTQATDIVRTFEAGGGLVCQPGRYVHVIVQTPVGTTTGVIRGDVMVDGYFEAVN